MLIENSIIMMTSHLALAAFQILRKIIENKKVNKEEGLVILNEFSKIINKKNMNDYEQKEIIINIKNIIKNNDKIKEIFKLTTRAVLPVENYEVNKNLIIRKFHRNESFTMANISDNKNLPISVLLESHQAKKSKAFIDFINETGLEPEIHIIGRAQVMLMNTRKDMPDPILEHRPGRSIAHYEGCSGTLGLYVIKTNSEIPILGFCSSSHVLLWNNINTVIDTPILSPGPPPDKYRNDSFTYGRYMNGQFIVPYTNISPGEASVNGQDIAWARMEDPSLFPGVNLVPKPDNHEKLTALKGILTEHEILHRLISKRQRDEPFRVFKIGQATGFTSGKLLTINSTAKTINFRNKNYLYDELALVIPDSKSFSRSGDSGSVVYSEDLMIVGFIVAATPSHSLIHLADPCLQSLGVEPCL